MALLLIHEAPNVGEWEMAFRAVEPHLPLEVWPKVSSPIEIQMVAAIRYPKGSLAQFSELRCVASLGAGAECALSDSTLPPNVMLTRVVEPSMISSMTQYIAHAVIERSRCFSLFRAQQIGKDWKRNSGERNPSVAILGLGSIGNQVAQNLCHLGFEVHCWSRSRHQLQGVTTWAGPGELAEFLSHAEFLVCLLPLTSETEDILDKKLFELLPKGAHLIQVGRGGHLVESDLIEAVNNGTLASATIDVFREEPLPKAHPFWAHPKIVVTPHIAAISTPNAAAAQIIENYHRLKNGEVLLNLIDRDRGY